MNDLVREFVSVHFEHVLADQVGLFLSFVAQELVFEVHYRFVFVFGTFCLPLFLSQSVDMKVFFLD